MFGKECERDDKAGAIEVVAALTEAPPARSSSRPPGQPANRLIIGTSPALLDVLDAVDRVAHSPSPVLLIGETGTGKDLLASRIHAQGPRRQRPYVVVNAGAIPPTLLDSELFGHVAGAFTGATKARRGLILEADGGTLFLDEIGDLPLELQGRLLRVLESKSMRPVGGDHERPVDVRFIAATHRDLAKAVRGGRFREDLFFRLNVLAIDVPPLRARRSDLPALIEYFLVEARARNPRSPVATISSAAQERLERSPWRGNVRELHACIERLVVQGTALQIEKSDVERAQPGRPGGGTDDSLPDSELVTLEEMTARYVETVLGRTNGDKSRAAAILGVDPSTLYRWARRRRTERGE